MAVCISTGLLIVACVSGNAQEPTSGTVAAAGAAGASVSPEPQWATKYQGERGRLAKLLVAVSGKQNSDALEQLLRGVTVLSRVPNGFTLQREDGATLLLPTGTATADRMAACLDKTELEARKRLGNDAADFVHNLTALSCEGDRVSLLHSGAPSVNIPLDGGQPYLPVPLRALRLGTISMRVVDSGPNSAMLQDINGIEATVHAGGVDLTVQPREFLRYKDEAGNTQLFFAIENPVPAFLRGLLHLPERLRFHYVVKKRDKRPENQ
jgi:hypothetical protein